jgi:hypothetical protein
MPSGHEFAIELLDLGFCSTLLFDAEKVPCLIYSPRKRRMSLSIFGKSGDSFRLWQCGRAFG